MLSLLLLCPIFVACKVHSPPTATVCTPKACFTWYSEGLSFHETADKCKDLGGDIATIRDQSELSEVEFVVSQLSEKDIKFWIGLRLPKSHCTLPILNLKGFKWISGAEDSQYSNWEKDPENTCTAERCVVVQRSSSLDLKWIDTSCKTKHFYLCRFYFKGTCPTLSVMGPSTKKQEFTVGAMTGINWVMMESHASLKIIACLHHVNTTASLTPRDSCVSVQMDSSWQQIRSAVLISMSVLCHLHAVSTYAVIPMEVTPVSVERALLQPMGSVKMSTSVPSQYVIKVA
ncbi:hypothetical protein AALO_G00248560 [Alosa alosa]|uniref:C-type lectin domain-containing protein n=1 Tax=Alosa alosa TaxID=278164 RepID=A0AAV6FXS7_9TELE|nr:hypothetical protein AALO_G00248560 [Alosa alosa]